MISKRLAALSLLFCFLSLGSGALQHLHEMQHLAADAKVDAIFRAAHMPVPVHHHDESDCQICAQLHLLWLAPGWTPLLVLLGLFVAFISSIARPLIARALPPRIDCRGPPALAF